MAKRKHRFVPVSLDVHDDTEVTEWRCIACGFRSQTPTADAIKGECLAEPLPMDAA